MTKRLLIPLLAWLLLMLAGIAALRGTPVTHDLTQFLPAGATQQQHLTVSLLRSGPASRLILIGLENAAPRQLAETSQRIARALQASGLFSQVNNGTQISSDRLQLEFRYRYLLDPNTTASSFDEQHLHSALQQRLDELSSALPFMDQRQLAADPTAALRSLLGDRQSARQPHLLYGVWFAPDERRALLAVITRATGLDADAQRQAIEAVHAAFDAAGSTPGTRLLLSGSPVFADDARNIIRSGLRSLSLAAALLVAAFLLIVYRSFSLLMLSGLPIVSGLLAGSVATAVIFGNIHGITLVFGITLLGIAIDYPIHLFSHLQPDRTPRQSMARIWPTLRLGVITTCLGYLAFARRDFTGLAQLGVFTTSGLLTAAAITRWLLPSLLTGVEIQVAHAIPTADRYSLVRIRRRPAIAILAVAGIALALLTVLSPPVWETDLAALSPVSDAMRRLDNSLRDAIGAPDVSQMIVVNRTDPEAVLESCEQAVGKLRGAVSRGLLSGLEAPTLYLPSIATQKLRQGHLPDAPTARRHLDSALRGLPFRQDAFAPFLDALSESRTLPPLTMSDVEGTLTGLRIQPLVFSDESGWHALILLSGVAPGAGFREWWQQQDMPDALFINLKETSAAMLADFRNSTLERLVLGIALILLVLSTGLRSIPSALWVALPILLAVALTATLLGAFGERLSLFHLISLLLTTGIGIDYSLFFQRREEQGPARISTLHALLVCVVSTVTVFGILACSPIPVLHSIGITVAIGTPLCFLLAFAASGWKRHTRQDAIGPAG